MLNLRFSFMLYLRQRRLPLLALVIVLHLAAIEWALWSAHKSGSGSGSGSGSSTEVTAELQMSSAAPAVQTPQEQPVPAVSEQPTVAPVPVPAVSQPQSTGGTGTGGDGGTGGNGGNGAGDGDGSADPSQAGLEVPGTSVEEALPITIPPASSKSARGASGIRGGHGRGNGKQAAYGAPKRYQVSVPPSAELLYKAHSRTKGQDLYGKGNIRWQSDGKTFSVQGEFDVLFLKLLNFRSEGTIDPDYGVSPVIYSEKKFRRSETNTHFQRAGKLISFSASTKAYLRQGGEQDRASVVWQLAGIGRRDPGKFKAGAEFDLVVAGVRDADVRRVRVAGLEEVDTELGRVQAWHLVDNRRPGSYERTLDVWLSPERNWYPVKLRYTEKSGDYLDLVLTEIRAPGAR